jgi:hypothetical protein
MTLTRRVLADKHIASVENPFFTRSDRNFNRTLKIYNILSRWRCVEIVVVRLARLTKNYTGRIVRLRYVPNDIRLHINLDILEMRLTIVARI